MRGIIFLHAVNVALSLVNNKVDWPTARQNEARWESQTENAREKKDGVTELLASCLGRCHEPHRLIKMGQFKCKS